MTAEAADALGLKAGLPVAVSSVDAHVGALGKNNYACSVSSYYSDINSAFSVLTLLIGCLNYLSRIQPSPKLLTSSVPHCALKKARCRTFALRYQSSAPHFFETQCITGT